jgi:hypothetical protein
MPEIETQTNLTINFENYHYNNSSTLIFLNEYPIPSKAKIFLQEIGHSISDNNLRRTELSKYIYDYIKTNNLYGHNHNKNIIYPDDNIRKLFSLNDDQTLDFGSINKNLNILYRQMRDVN